MKLRLALGGLLAAALVAVVGSTLGARPSAVNTRHEVTMRGNSFRPRSLTIQLGDTVAWVNRDIVRHNAVRPESFDTGELNRGEEYDWVPADTGTFRYECTIHQRMRGVVRVESR